MINNGRVENYCRVEVNGQYIENGIRSDHDPSKVTTGTTSTSTCRVTWKKQTDTGTSNVGTGNTIANLTAGTYLVEIDCGNGCLRTETIVLLEGASTIDFTAQVVATTNGCNGEINVANITGGQAPYTFLLDNVQGLSLIHI